MENQIIYPDYIRIVKRKLGGWLILRGKPFYNPKQEPMEFKHLYGITEEQLSIELFRLNGGKAGYYLVDLRGQKYYYCGMNLGDVQKQMHTIGIGRIDPTD